jgi:phage protein D
MVPSYQLVIDGVDRTDTLRPYLLSLTVCDKTGYSADSLNLVLANPMGQVQVPKVGTKIQLALGYQTTGLYEKGVFVVDEVSLRGPPDQLVVHARSLNIGQALHAVSTAFWEDVTLAEVVEEVASASGLQATVGDAFEAIELVYLSRERESDLAFLTRLAQQYHAILKIQDQQLLFLSKDSLVNGSGTSMPTITIAPAQVLKYRLTLPQRSQIKSVQVPWYDRTQAKVEYVSEPDGAPTPTHAVATVYVNEATAKAVAQTTLKNWQVQQAQLSLDCVGIPECVAQAQLELTEQTLGGSGFTEPLAGTYLIHQVQHQLNQQGYTLRIEATGQPETTS